MFLLVPAYPGCPGSKAVKQSLLLSLYWLTQVVSDNGPLNVCLFVFSALTLLVGHWKVHPVCIKLSVQVLGCWRGHLSGARCIWFLCGPADATVTLNLSATNIACKYLWELFSQLTLTLLTIRD